MPQLADDPKISALKVSTQGQVTLSKEARQLHGLDSGQTVIEIALPGCIILLPQSKVMADLMLRAQEELGKLGVTVDQLKSAVNKRSKSRLKTRYPGVFNDKT
jgi:bifunctional DNA-binding transcriptional regulator/antitoxin component of YhaV-PrlF toxin-antitoxin module